jgi:hypothetical protein
MHRLETKGKLRSRTLRGSNKWNSSSGVQARMARFIQNSSLMY